MTYLELLNEIEDMIDNNEVNQFDEVNIEKIKKMLDKVTEK
jgi:hypothetical protein